MAKRDAGMIGAICRSAVASLLATFVWAAISHSALAQAGSTGGSVGKQDKSISGGEETPASRSAAPASKPAAMSVAGRWHWMANCQSGHWAAGFQITQGMSGQINGSLFSDPVNGSITGQVSNGIISFTRSALVLTQHWTGQLAEGGRHIINGTITGNENCTWEARRE
jgi:hypothetical protein